MAKITTKKTPAFLFYVQDFLIGTKDMSAAEIGGYVLLLCHQWDNGKIEADTKFLQKISKISSKKLEKILLKFKKKGGYYYNERLELERHKRLKFIEKQQGNGKKGGRKKQTQTEPKPNPNQTLSFSFSTTNNSREEVPQLPIEESVKLALIKFRPELSDDIAKREALLLLKKYPTPNSQLIEKWAGNIRITERIVLLRHPQTSALVEWPESRYEAEKHRTGLIFIKYAS